LLEYQACFLTDRCKVIVLCYFLVKTLKKGKNF